MEETNQILYFKSILIVLLVMTEAGVKGWAVLIVIYNQSPQILTQLES